MRPRVVLVAAVALLAACSTNPEKRVPRAAADAMTGSPWTMTAVSSLTLEGSGKGTDATGAAFAVTSFHRVMNFKKGGWSHLESRNGGPAQAQTLSPAERLHYPFGYLMAAFAPNAKLGNTRTEGSTEAVDLVVDGSTHTLYVDAQTKLPVRIVTAGNPAVETSFADYVIVHGYHLPSRITRTSGSSVVWELNTARQIASADAVEARPGS